MNDLNDSTQTSRTVHEEAMPIDRRTFLKGAAAGAAGLIGLSLALSPLLELESGELNMHEFLQKHYRELSPEELDRILRRIEEQTAKDYGVKPRVRDIRPLDGVEFAYALNLSRCIGCRRCVHACLAENNQSRESEDDVEMSYIRVLQMEGGSMNLEAADQYYDPDFVPDEGNYYMPVQCHQCRSAPCTKACPVQATWTQEDGITVVDYNWCIGCRYCMAACPYYARRFNFKKPTLQAKEINPNQSYLSNRIRPKGVVEKCTFCLHRTREGRLPACMEVCPTGSRIFGNVADPDSEIRHVLKNKRVYILKEDVGTLPRFYYFFDV